MRSTSYIAFALTCLVASSVSAPTPRAGNIIGSITNPSAGDDNIIKGNGDKNGNGNGNHNSAGNENGNDNKAGDGNKFGNGNKFEIEELYERGHSEGPSAIIGSITNPSAGDDNDIEGNGNKNGNMNGNGNEAGDKNGNQNAAGDGNKFGNGNKFEVDDLSKRGHSEGATEIIGSITHPSAGNGNDIEGNGDGNGNGNGNGNKAGNGNGNGNVAGSGNQFGNDNEFDLVKGVTHYE